MNPLKTLREYLSDYCHFEDKHIVRPLSLWIAGTYVFDAFDSYPYIAINSRTKRSGLDARGMSTLLAMFNLRPKPIRNAVTDNSKAAKLYKGKGQNIARGYLRRDIELAARAQGVQ